MGVTLHVLSATTGQLQREIPLPLTTPQKLAMTTVEVFGTTVVLDVGELVAFDAITGVERWRAPGRLDPALPAHWFGSDAPSSYGPAPGPERRSSITALPPRRAGNAGCATSARRSTGPPPPGRTSWSSNVTATGPSTPQDRAAPLAVDPEQGVVGVPGMTGRDLFLVGGCPLTSAD